MGPEGIFLVNPPITTLQQSLTVFSFQFFNILLGNYTHIEPEEWYIIHIKVVNGGKLVHMRPQMVWAEASLSGALTTMSSSWRLLKEKREKQANLLSFHLNKMDLYF